MKFRHNETGNIFQSEFEFRQAYPNISFPPTLDQNALDFANVSIVVETPLPVATDTQRIDYDGVQFIDGQWKDVWTVRPLFDDPTQQAEFVAERLLVQWDIVRGERDQKLKDTDYTDLPNTPITTQCRNNFITYRQQLRDITSQQDPYNIVWPQIPEYIRN